MDSYTKSHADNGIQFDTVPQESITVIAEKKLRIDGLILNNGQSHSFELFPSEHQ